MKGKKKFVAPVMLQLRKERDFCPNLSSIMGDPAFLRILPRCRTGGTMRTVSYEVQIKVGKWYRKFSFCWRPDVTLYYLGVPQGTWLRPKPRWARQGARR